MYCKPIFIAGKEVPQRELAITVNNIAFFLSSAARFGFCKNYSFLFEKGKRMFLRLFLKKLRLQCFLRLSQVSNSIQP